MNDKKDGNKPNTDNIAKLPTREDLQTLKYTHPKYCTYCNQKLDEEGLAELRADIKARTGKECTWLKGVLALPIPNMGLCHFVCPRCKGVMMNEECYENQAVIRHVQSSKIIQANANQAVMSRDRKGKSGIITLN